MQKRTRGIPSYLPALGLGFLLATSAAVTTGAQVAAPTITQFSFSPTLVDNTMDQTSITVTLQVVAPGGLAHGNIWFRSPSGRTVSGYVGPYVRTSGNAENGTYSSTFYFPNFGETGSWLASVSLNDNAGNAVTITTGQLEASGLPATVIVTGQTDTMPPSLDGFTFAPTAVDVSLADAVIAFSLQLSDHPAGVFNATIDLRSPTGRQMLYLNLSDWSIVAGGTRQQGTFEGAITIPRYAEQGTWRIVRLALRDWGNNYVALNEVGLQGRGYPTTVEVTSDPQNTPAGPNVTVGTDNATVGYTQVTMQGVTTVVPIAPESAGLVPGGFTLDGAVAFEVTTTAQYAGPVTVCFDASSVTDDPIVFATVRVLHGEGAGLLVDRTVLPPDTPAPDFAARTICARVPSLSPFVIVKPSQPPDTAAPILSGVPGDMTVEATSPAGAQVTWTMPTAIDDVDRQVAVTCTRAPGLFALGSHPVSCSAADAAGNVAAAGFTISVVDTTPPAIAIVSPSAKTYVVGAVVAAAYSCTDGVSAVASCAGAVPSGTAIDTSSPGTFDFTVTASDAAGNSASATVRYAVSYGVNVLSGGSRVLNAESTIPLRVRLVDAYGTNASSAAIGVRAVALEHMGGGGTLPAEDAGHANPGGFFRYDEALAGYVFNLKTVRGMAPGTWRLSVSVAGDPVVHHVSVDVR